MGVTIRYHRGAWWVFVRYENKRTSRRIGSKEAALKVKAEIEERFAKGAFKLPAKDGISLEKYARAWISGAGLKVSTVRFYLEKLKNHIEPVLGSLPVHQITRADVKRLLTELNAKGLKPKTITGVIRTLSTFLSEAVEDGHLQANPALRPGRLKRKMGDPNVSKKTDIDPYTRDEVEILLETAKRSFPEWHPFLMCGFRTGMRLGETRALEWGSIDWRQRFIRVERNFVEGSFTTPKNGRDRDVDMSLQLRAVLRLWRRQQRREWLARGLSLPDLVFPSDVRQPLDDSRIRKAVVAIVKKAELRRRKKILHVMRHTFASLLLQQGESPTYVKEQMGHSSIQVTVDIYGHLIPGGNRAAVDRLDSPSGIPAASEAEMRAVANGAKSFILSGEPPRNRTENPQIRRSRGSVRPVSPGRFL